VQAFVSFFKTLGAARIVAMGAVTLALMAFFAYLIVRATAPQMSPLFTDLSVEDSSAIVKDLERQGIPFDIKNEGTMVLVAREQIPRLRMKLAEGGLPKGGGVGYEIFDKSDALGATSFVQNINHLRALEGELSRTIRAIDRVQQARVHLVLPERPLFSREKAEPSASIVLKVRGSLEAQQVRAIRHLIASAVNGLKPQRVSVVDETGRLLADGSADDSGGATADERKLTYERRLREQVESIVSSVVGPGHARVQLTAEFDFNRITQTSDKYDPESRVVRSSQTREEVMAGNDPNAGSVSVGNELPGANARPEGAQQPRDQNRKTEEIVNYEISRTTKTEVIEGGRVNRVSVAVVVDGIYAKNDKGELAYQPRSKEEIDRITALVKSAIGFEQKRGDQVEVVNLRFADSPVVPVAEEQGGMFSSLRFTTDDIFQGVQILVIVVLSGLVLLFVIRPLVRRIITPDEGARARATPAQTPDATLPAIAAPALAAPDNPAARLIEVAQIQGEVQAQSVQKVGELADRNPHETVSILRQWMHEKTA